MVVVLGFFAVGYGCHNGASGGERGWRKFQFVGFWWFQFGGFFFFFWWFGVEVVGDGGGGGCGRWWQWVLVVVVGLLVVEEMRLRIKNNKNNKILMK